MAVKSKLTISLLIASCLVLIAQMNISNPFYTVGMKLTGAAGVAHGSYATNEVFSSFGAYTWTVPTGVTQAVVEVWGGGGAGAGFDFSNPYSHGGGGGGGYSLQTFAVTNSTVMDYYVGAGGIGSTGGDGFDGEASYFISAAHCNAAGGTGALINGGGGTGGWGGPGNTTYNGGDGGEATSTDDYGGGGGGSAGTDANGTAGTYGDSGGAGGGSGTDGGVGGNGGAAESFGSDGTQPGGGGGGGGISAANGTAGGAGAAGRLRISYTVYY